MEEILKALEPYKEVVHGQAMYDLSRALEGGVPRAKLVAVFGEEVISEAEGRANSEKGGEIT